MTAQASDHLDKGSTETAMDLLSLLQLVIDQANLDAGDMTFALFQDAPGPVAPTSKAFSQLADQRWITIGLSFLKEAISSRRSEVAGGKKPNMPPAPTTTIQRPRPRGRHL